MKESITRFVIFVLLIIGLVGCNIPDNTEEVDPALYLVSDNFILYVGDEKEIEYYVDNLEEYELDYQISDNDIIKVEDDKIIALAAGDATLKISIVGHEDIYQEATIKVIAKGSEAHNSIINWIKLEIGDELEEAKLFPKNHPSYPTAVISYESSDPALVSDKGLLYPEDYDKEATIKISVDYNGEIVIINHKVNVVGKIPNEISKDFLGQFYTIISNDVNINYFESKYPFANITFRSSNEEVLSNTGKFTKPQNDVHLTIFASIEIPSEGYSREYSKSVTARGLSISEKALLVKDDVVQQLNLTNFRITDDLELPFTEERFSGTLVWTSSNTDVLSTDGTVNQPLLNTLIELRGQLNVGGLKSTFVIELEILGRESGNKWEDIEEFLNFYIFNEEIETLKYTVMGVAPSYPAYNDGYVLFYQNKDLDVIEDILPTSHPFRPKTPMTVKYITIHDTAGNGPGADAAMHSKFIHNENRSASSWHYTIDDHELYQHIPNNEVAWHAGDGSGPGNRSSIGIETCTNQDGDYDLVILRTAKLVAKLLDDHDLTLYNVRQHYNWSGKNCPQVIRGSNRWGEVMDLIGLELYARQNLKDVNFEWKSLSPTILNDSGMVFAHPGAATEVSFQVTVTFNNETRVYTHQANLQAKK